MLKKILPLLFIAGLASTCTAEAATTDFTYAQGSLFAYGQGKKENIDVAMRIDNTTLTGMKITGIKAYITGIDGIENTSIWFSKQLTLENKVNVPDIASYNVTPVETPFYGDKLGLLQLNLAEPLEIPDGPLYIGYSMTVADNAKEEQKFPMVLSEGSNPDGLFLHMSKSVLKWMDYNEKAEGVAYIVVTIEGDFSEYSLAIRETNVAYVTQNEPYNLEFIVSNNGQHQVKSLKYKYWYDNSPNVAEQTLTLPAPLNADITTTWPITLSFNGLTGVGPHILNIDITEIDGHPNNSGYSNAATIVNVMPYRPIHRPLVEEYTGLWCGWCTRGYVGMELLSEKYKSEYVPICYHNKDPMAVTNVYPVPVEGYPATSLNRRMIVDPYYGTYLEDVDFGISFDVEELMAEMTMADIHVASSLEGNTVNVQSQTTFMIDVDDADYEVAYVLVCNGLSDPDWAQKNFYAGLESSYEGTYLEEMCKEPSSVKGLVFNDVAVDVSGMMGIENSLPETIKTGVTYTHEYSFDITGNELVQNPENLVVCAIVIDKATGFAVNANQCAINTSGVNKIESDATVVETVYYDLTGRKLSNPGKGIVIKQDRLSDGRIIVEKIVKR